MLLKPVVGPRTAIHLSGQWFAAVMGTGILAAALTVSPVTLPGLASTAWVVATGLLVTMLTLVIAGWRRDPAAARHALFSAATIPFLGAIAMAILTVGHGALLAGHTLIGHHAAVVVDLICWIAGTAVGLGTLVLVPLTMLRRDRPALATATGAWLMPVVPPMVSAATGAALATRGEFGHTFFLTAGLVLFTLAFAASAVILGIVVTRLVRHPAVPAAVAPAFVIPLGVLGQSATAAVGLAVLAGPEWVTAGVRYAETSLLVALLWSLLAGRILVRAIRTGLPVSLGWWAFTFPVGTCVTGAGVLAAVTGSQLATVGSVLALVVLAAGWLLAATGTVAGIRTGRIALAVAGVPGR